MGCWDTCLRARSSVFVRERNVSFSVIVQDLWGILLREVSRFFATNDRCYQGILENIFFIHSGCCCEQVMI